MPKERSALKEGKKKASETPAEKRAGKKAEKDGRKYSG